MKLFIKRAGLRTIIIPVFLSFSCITLGAFSFQPVSASDLEQWLGRDLVKRSLNKKITVTPKGSWTEHRPAGTGIDRHIISSCRTQPKRGKYESWSRYQQRLRDSLAVWSKDCR